MSFKHSRYYGSRVGPAKRERGWLSNEEFTRLGQQEFRDYRRGFGGGQGGGPSGGGIGRIIVLIVAALGVLSLLWR